MREIHIPYCRETLPLHVEEKNLSAVLTARMHEYDPGQPEAAIVQEALEHPIGTPRLRELAKGKKKVVLVTSDHTRAVPSRLTLPLLLALVHWIAPSVRALSHSSLKLQLQFGVDGSAGFYRIEKSGTLLCLKAE